MNLPEDQLLALAQSLIADRDVMRDWTLDHMILWLRHHGPCEYCGFDLLQSRGMAYQYWTIDHILPQAKYPDFAATKWNWALCCRECNALKGQYDPSVAEELALPTPEQHRAIWVERSRREIEKKREPAHKRFAEERRRILDAIAGRAAGASA
jgi:hypothetical protein